MRTNAAGEHPAPWEADLSFDLAALVKEHWEKLVIAAGGIWYVVRELLARADKAAVSRREADQADKAAKVAETKTLDEMAREGLNLAFASMKAEIGRLSGEVSALEGKIDQMQSDFSTALIAKDADLRASEAENRKLRADYDAISRTLAACADQMLAAGLAPPIVPKQFQAVQISAKGEISTMGSTE